MTLLDAPFRRELRVASLTRLPEDLRVMLLQLGIEPGEAIEKVHSAPLGEPLTVRIGNQFFALRAEVCLGIDVEDRNS